MGRLETTINEIRGNEFKREQGGVSARVCRGKREGSKNLIV